jgi:hypothetical protein
MFLKFNEQGEFETSAVASYLPTDLDCCHLWVRCPSNFLTNDGKAFLHPSFRLVGGVVLPITKEDIELERLKKNLSENCLTHWESLKDLKLVSGTGENQVIERDLGVTQDGIDTLYNLLDTSKALGFGSYSLIISKAGEKCAVLNSYIENLIGKISSARTIIAINKEQHAALINKLETGEAVTGYNFKLDLTGNNFAGIPNLVLENIKMSPAASTALQLNQKIDAAIESKNIFYRVNTVEHPTEEFKFVNTSELRSSLDSFIREQTRLLQRLAEGSIVEHAAGEITNRTYRWALASGTTSFTEELTLDEVELLLFRLNQCSQLLSRVSADLKQSVVNDPASVTDATIAETIEGLGIATRIGGLKD